MTKTQTTVLKIAAVLWVIWGLVHMLGGVLTIAQETAGAVAGIADAVDPGLLANTYHDAVGAVINQHGFNLLWDRPCHDHPVPSSSGAGNMTAIWVTAMVGGLADVGYLCSWTLAALSISSPERL